MSGPRLAIRGLQRSFPGVRALDGVDLAADPGEVVALLGENGAGKSTLVGILAGLLAPHGGEILLDGVPYRPRDPRRAAASGVAVVHQHFQLVEAFTVAENLRLALGVARAEAGAVLARVEERLGLPLPPAGARVAGLGVGERQRVELARALAGSPRLLLLDEPTAVLTPAEAASLFTAVRRLAEGGATVLYITHRLDEVRRVADRVVVLRRGRVVAELPADAPEEELAAAMVGPLAAAPPRHRGEVGCPVVVARRVAVAGRLEPTDLVVRRAEVVALAGVDGNGQGALAARVAGMAAGAGAVEVEGVPLPAGDPAAARRAGVWLVPEDRVREGIVPAMSVAENVILGRHRRRPWCRGGIFDPAAVAAEGARVVARYGIAGTAGQPAGTLSGGNQQRVAVARALEADPRVLVAVHPTRGLDVAAARAVEDLLAGAAAAGTAVLVVTAELEQARRLAHRILVFSRGRVVGEGDPETPEEVLASWMGGVAA